MRASVEDLFHKVADLPVEARAGYFDKHGIDGMTRSEVEALMAFDLRSTDSLEKDIGQVADHVARQALKQLEPQDMRCGPYRLTDLLGRGGMGAVYLAERVDGEVAHRVAVKLLRPGADTRQVRQRFLAERQILATLSHPNIARLLDAGHCDDGQPYLVMEYVDGKPIDVYTAGLDIRRKIALFLKVCAAVGYLHRNLVIHRDLKPANILVTAEGEAKLLDFGIAKMLDLATDSTVTSMRMLTPDYASPEQVTGGAMSTATDVYSLGAVLYKLLTGASPHQFESDSAGAIALAISTGKITPAAKLAPDLKGDLETILMKALRTEAQERYATIEQFSEDLESYLEARPIRARKGDSWYRTRKFLRRHWLPVAAGVLAVASLAGGALVANRQRAIAQRRFMQVRQLSNKLFDIDTEVRQVPGTTKARELIVSTSLEYLQRLAEDAKGDIGLAFELGNAYLSVARVQGVPIGLNLGHTDEADRSLRMAERLMDSVLLSQPGNRTALSRSAQIARDRMIIAEVRSRHEDVLTFGRKSEELLSEYERSGKVDRPEAEEVIRAYTNIANCYATENQWADAIRLSRHAKELALAAGLPRRAGSALLILAKAFHSSGDLEEALQASREAVRLLEPPAGTRNTAESLALVAALVREGEILGDENTVSLGRPEEAVAPLERAYAITEDLARQDPNDGESRARLFNASVPLARILRQQHARRALILYDHTLNRLAELPNNVRAQRKEIWVLAASTYALRRLGRNAEVRNRLDAALVRLRALKLYPADETGAESYEVLCAIADHEAAIGNVPRATEVYEELLHKMVTANPKSNDNLDAAVDLTRVYAAYAALHRRAGQIDLAFALETRRLELWRHWDRKLPNNTFVRRQLEIANLTRGFRPNFHRDYANKG
jgi:tRNA A-37 threonylcarbamoyl transferase component Bud32/tetratricopeptide (TPR) repeat protein